jgi:hypothetical protein
VSEASAHERVVRRRPIWQAAEMPVDRSALHAGPGMWIALLRAYGQYCR